MATIPYPKPDLTHGQITLRRVRLADVVSWHAATEHQGTARWVNALPTTDPTELLQRIESSRRAGRLISLVIADAMTDGYLGSIALFMRPHQIGEIAFVVAPEARGKGVATLAVGLLSGWAFDSLALARLQLLIEEPNAASRRVATKAGYRAEGVLRSCLVIRGRRIDALSYSRLPNDA